MSANITEMETDRNYVFPMKENNLPYTKNF